VAFQAALARGSAALVAPTPPGAGFEPAARRAAGGGALASVTLVTAADRTVRTDATAPPRDPALPAARDPALPPGTDLAADPAAARTFDLATDTGLVQVSPPVRLGPAGARLLLIAPRYAPGRPARSVTERRAAVVGFVVGTIDVRGLASRLLAPVAPGGVEIRDTSDVLFRRGHPRRLALEAPVAPGGERAWTVRVGTPRAGHAFPVALLLGGTALAVAVAAAGRHLARSRDAALARAEARARDLALVAEAGSLLHESLELADVLPALAVTLMDRLDLDGVAVALADDQGGLTEAFTAGAHLRSAPARAGDLANPATGAGPVAPGAEAWVPVVRGGRVLGAVGLKARHPLDGGQLAALAAVGEVLGSAVANAAVYRREQEAARRLQEVDAVKTDFLSTVSHELRTPVTAIRGFATLLDESWERLDDDQRRDLIGRIARNAGSLTVLVNDLLDFARLERRSLQVRVETVDLAAVVAAVVDQNATLVEDHTIALHAEPGVRALADPNAVERILANLLTNAAKFSPPGTTITVHVGEADGRAVLTVDDEGPGVPPAERQRVFSRFYRGPHEHAVRTRGAGVGLAVVAELAERLGATVTVGDAPGGGARFSVAFAVPRAAPAPQQEAARR
jgi:signal transduction histidine kinase